jgi:hypothetical protein
MLGGPSCSPWPKKKAASGPGHDTRHPDCRGARTLTEAVVDRRQRADRGEPRPASGEKHHGPGPSRAPTFRSGYAAEWRSPDLELDAKRQRRAFPAALDGLVRSRPVANSASLISAKELAAVEDTARRTTVRVRRSQVGHAPRMSRMETAAVRVDVDVVVPAPFHGRRRTIVALVSASVISLLVWALVVVLKVQ